MHRREEPPHETPTARPVVFHAATAHARTSRAPHVAKDGRASPEREAEFKAIYESHFRLVWRALGRLGVREPDLMDLTQKVFLTAYLKLPHFEGRSLVSTWLWGICRRVASGHRRSGAVRYEVATDPVSLEVSAEQRGAITASGESSRHLLLESILSKLSEPQRVVFMLFEVDEMDGREIATLLNISLGTVRSRLRYARKLFRREVRRQAIANAFPKSRG
ncbi:MAG TPA: sigma-70 family RNA polymerase sigma factor [Polyangiaceae bacterium]|jgi:RNA polymerase sigma-70 factor (ECF subfamily)|nr:sigma-70 family RNA polymerase sigma factor [Polyangiaceae bacterium]